MDVERTQVASRELAHDAESLVRSLAGVTHARVTAGPRGIEAIDIIASDTESARQMAGRVRSALLAGLATPILPARIHVRVADDPVETPATRSRTGAPSNGGDQGKHRIRLLDTRPERPTAPDPTRGTTAATTSPNVDTTPGERGDPGSQMARGATDDAEPFDRPLGKPRLVAVDTDRQPDGRLRCRVSVAYAARVFSAEAVAIDLPGAAAQTAAQATVRALAQAGIPGLELSGLREVEIAGREYLVVALRRTDTSRRHRSGSAPIIGSAERSAAEATVVAAIDLI